MADGILAAVNENGNIDRFIDTKGGVHYIEPKRYEESVAKIDAAATKAKETVNSATEAVSECKAQTGACTQETARAKEIADTVESRITGIEGDVAALRDSVSRIIKTKQIDATTDTNGYLKTGLNAKQIPIGIGGLSDARYAFHTGNEDDNGRTIRLMEWDGSVGRFSNKYVNVLVYYVEV